MKNSRAFTLIELIITIAIIAVLAAIAIPSYKGLIKKSNDAALYASIGNLNTYMGVQFYNGDFDEEHFFTYKKNQTNGGEEYFARFLEVKWEVLNGAGDSDNSNNLGALNYVSKKTGVVNWDNPTSLNELYKNQALYITTSNTASYDVNALKTLNDCYKGAIILWYDGTVADNLYIYYVDSDGLQSSKYHVFTHS